MKNLQKLFTFVNNCYKIVLTKVNEIPFVMDKLFP